VRIGSLAWLLVHFTLTLLYVSPDNALRRRYLPLLEATIGWFFYQNWSFFAPNPVMKNESLLVRCLDLVGADAEFASEGLPTTGWHDLSTPLWVRHQENRLAAYDRVARPQANALRLYFGVTSKTAHLVARCRAGSKPDCEAFEKALQQSRKFVGPLLGRIGSSFCLAQSGHADMTHVAVRVRMSVPPTWEKRFSDGPTVTDLDAGVYAIQRDVVASGLYIGESPSQ